MRALNYMLAVDDVGSYAAKSTATANISSFALNPPSRWVVAAARGGVSGKSNGTERGLSFPPQCPFSSDIDRQGVMAKQAFPLSVSRRPINGGGMAAGHACYNPLHCKMGGGHVGWLGRIVLGSPTGPHAGHPTPKRLQYSIDPTKKYSDNILVG